MDMQKIKLLLFFLIFLLTINAGYAFSNCQFKYDSDKRSLPELRGMCNVCHFSPNGAGPQNEFGRAFKGAGFKITDQLVKQFPEFFKQPEDNSQNSPGTEEPLSPSITRIKPPKVKIGSMIALKIQGKNFIEGAKALIDNNETLTTFKSNILLIVNFVFNAAGIHEIKVQNPDGSESNTVKIKVKDTTKNK